MGGVNVIALGVAGMEMGGEGGAAEGLCTDGGVYGVLDGGALGVGGSDGEYGGVIEGWARGEREGGEGVDGQGYMYGGGDAYGGIMPNHGADGGYEYREGNQGGDAYSVGGYEWDNGRVYSGRSGCDGGYEYGKEGVGAGGGMGGGVDVQEMRECWVLWVSLQH